MVNRSPSKATTFQQAPDGGAPKCTYGSHVVALYGNTGARGESESEVDMHTPCVLVNDPG